jgi:hypothetical protein
MTETTELNAEVNDKEFVRVPLQKSVYEKNWRNLISYKPVSKTGKTYPIWLWKFDNVEETWGGKDVIVKDYDEKFWASLSVHEESEKWELLLTLNKVETSEYKKYFLVKKQNKDGKTVYGSAKTIEIWGTSYWINLTPCTPTKGKPQIMNLIFNAADGGWAVGSETEISFGAETPKKADPDF